MRRVQHALRFVDCIWPGPPCKLQTAQDWWTGLANQLKHFHEACDMHSATLIRDKASLCPTARLLLSVFAAIALFLQSYVTQAHFHELYRPAAMSIAHTHGTTTALPAGKQHHLPSPNDPDICPLCHSLYNGQYITPSLAAYFLAMLSVSIIATRSGMSPHYDAVSHSWHGRGPPHN